MTLKVLKITDVRGWQWTFFLFIAPLLPEPDAPGVIFEFPFPLLDSAHMPLPVQLWMA